MYFKLKCNGNEEFRKVDTTRCDKTLAHLQCHNLKVPYLSAPNIKFENKIS